MYQLQFCCYFLCGLEQIDFCGQFQGYLYTFIHILGRLHLCSCGYYYSTVWWHWRLSWVVAFAKAIRIEIQPNRGRWNFFLGHAVYTTSVISALVHFLTSGERKLPMLQIKWDPMEKMFCQRGYLRVPSLAKVKWHLSPQHKQKSWLCPWLAQMIRFLLHT